MIRTKEDEKIVLAQLRKKSVMELVQKKDGEGELIFDMDKPLMVEVPKLKNGKSIILDDLTIEELVSTYPDGKEQSCWDGKVRACKARLTKE